MKTRKTAAGILAFAALVGFLWWQSGRPKLVAASPQAVMGTTCQLAVVAPAWRQIAAGGWLRDAEAALRRLESRMSTWIDSSEISRLNAAPAGEVTGLSADTLLVLQIARDAYEDTGGAFDVTCRPLVRLWREAGESGQMPSDAEIAAAREASNWGLLELTPNGTVVKHRDSCCVDLGGIAKGYAIDVAARCLEQPAASGGMVDVGGDVLLFGADTQGKPWDAAVKNPFEEGTLLKVEAGPRAVCTSGDYARGVQIEGRRLSHIIDPRTGRPAEAAASVTVLAPSAMEADIWATALSVLGPEGLDRLPVGFEALLIARDNQDTRLIATPGMKDRLLGETPEGMQVEVR